MRLGFSIDEAPVKVKVPEGKDDAATFLVGFMPAEKLDELMVQHQLSGILAEKPTAEAFKSNRDADREFVRWGIRGHEDLLGKDGKPIPFETEEAEYQGEKRQVVSRKLLEHYQRGRLIPSLALAVVRHQGLTPEEKKS